MCQQSASLLRSRTAASERSTVFHRQSFMKSEQTWLGRTMTLNVMKANIENRQLFAIFVNRKTTAQRSM